MYGLTSGSLLTLLDFKDDEAVLNRIAEIKMNRKKDLAAYVKEVEG